MSNDLLLRRDSQTGITDGGAAIVHGSNALAAGLAGNDKKLNAPSRGAPRSKETGQMV
jgi:hypothetical protein